MRDERWEFVGRVGVDSGQLMIIDPCYLEDNWKDEQWDFSKDRYFFEFPDGTREEVKMASPRWFELVERSNAGELKLIEEHKEPENALSYYGVSHATLKNHHADIDKGMAAAFRSGMGDGCYPVYAKIVDTGSFGERVAEVRIVMLGPEVEEEEEEEEPEEEAKYDEEEEE